VIVKLAWAPKLLRQKDKMIMEQIDCVNTTLNISSWIHKYKGHILVNYNNGKWDPCKKSNNSRSVSLYSKKPYQQKEITVFKNYILVDILVKEFNYLVNIRKMSTFIHVDQIPQNINCNNNIWNL
jgi:hypothetical protein